MTAIPFFHGSFTLRRTWAASPARVFAAWADPAIKAQWFTGPPEHWTELRRSAEFRVGGIEVLEGRFKASGMISLFEARYHLIEPDARLVYTYDLHHSGNFHSINLASLLLEAEGARTRVAYTEQIVFLDGKDGTASRQTGTELQFAMIERALGLNTEA